MLIIFVLNKHTISSSRFGQASLQVSMIWIDQTSAEPMTTKFANSRQCESNTHKEQSQLSNQPRKYAENKFYSKLIHSKKIIIHSRKSLSISKNHYPFQKNHYSFQKIIIHSKKSLSISKIFLLVHIDVIHLRHSNRWLIFHYLIL